MGRLLPAPPLAAGAGHGSVHAPWQLKRSSSEYIRNGFAALAVSATKLGACSESTIVKSRPNFSDISSCHLRVNPAGHTIMTRPSPVPNRSSSATKSGLDGLAEATLGEEQLTRGAVRPRATARAGSPRDDPGPEWRLKVIASAEVAADQRTASRKAANRSGGSKCRVATSGEGATLAAPATRLDPPDHLERVAVPPSSVLCKVTKVDDSPRPPPPRPALDLEPRPERRSTTLPASPAASLPKQCRSPFHPLRVAIPRPSVPPRVSQA